MNITYEVKAMLSNTKSGIGYYQKYIIETLLRMYPENKVSLDCMSVRNNDDKYDKLDELARSSTNCHINICTKLPYSLYRIICLLVPIPFKYFFKEEADISHFFNYYLPPGLKGKKIVTIYDMVIKEFPQTMKFQTKLMLNLNLKHAINKADCIITISEFSKREIMRYYNVKSDKIKVVYCGISKERFKKDFNKEIVGQVLNKYQIDKDYFLYLGTLEPRKNIENLVRAYYEFLYKYKEDVKVPLLILAGGKGWSYQSIYDLVEELKIGEWVKFTGYVGDQDAPVLMSNALAFCYPSLYEGFGMPPLEAMACGTPVITSNVASLPEVVGDAAIYVNPYSIESIENALSNMYSNENERKRLVQLGYERVELFSWEKSCEKLISIYHSLVDE